MPLSEIFAVAFQSVRANKLRSMLTMLGIVIGVAAVITMVALGSGAQKAVEDRIKAGKRRARQVRCLVPAGLAYTSPRRSACAAVPPRQRRNACLFLGGSQILRTSRSLNGGGVNGHDPGNQGRYAA